MTQLISTSNLLMRVKNHLPALCLWSVGCILFFAPVLLQQSYLPLSDFSAQFYTFARFQARMLWQGVWPFWSDGSYGGFPFTADPQAAVYYLPRLLFILFSGPDKFTFYTLQLEAITHVWAAGVGMYGLVYTFTRHKPAGLIAAMGFALSCYLLSYPLLQLAILETMAWWPWLVWLIYRLNHSSQPWWWSGLVGVILATAITAGHPQTALLTAYLLLVYYLFSSYSAGWSWPHIFGRGLLIAGVGLTLSAPMWLPAGLYMSLSTRETVDYAFVSTGLPLLHLAEIFLPHTLTSWSPTYPGLLILFLAGLAWPGRWQNPAVRFWFIFLAVLFLLALGDSGVLFQAGYYLMPGLAWFRQQERWWAIICFIWPILAGYGYSFWVSTGRLKTAQVVGWLGLGLLVSAITVAVRAGEVAFLWPGLAEQLLILGAIFLLLYQPLPGRWASFTPALLLLVALADSVWHLPQTLNLQHGSPAVYWPQREWVEQLQKTAGRVDSLNIFWANFGEVYGLQDIRGISPLKLKTVERVSQLPYARQWELQAVTHVLWQGEVGAGVPMTAVGEIANDILPTTGRTATIWQIDQPHPRAWMVYDRLVLEEEEAWQKLADPQFNIFEQVILNQDTRLLPTPPPTPPMVKVLEQKPGFLAVEVETATQGFLVLSEWVYPGWQLTIDGEEASIWTAYNSLQATWVQPGRHVVVSHYVPLVDYVGWVLAFVGLVSLGLVLVWSKPVTLPTLPRPVSPIPAAEPPFSLPHQQWHWLMVGLMLVAFGLRVYTAGFQELRSDEAASYLITSGELTQLLPNMVGANDPHPPFHYLMLWGWQRLAGSSELALRWLTICGSLLLIPLTAQLARLFTTRWVAWWAAVGLALSQSQVWIGQDVRHQYVWGIVAILWSSYCLGQALKTGRWWWLGYVLGASWAMYTHYYTIFALVGHFFLVYHWSSEPKLHRLLKWSAAGVSAAVLFLPWLWLQYQSTVGGQFGQLNEVALEKHFWEIAPELVVGSAFATPLVQPALTLLTGLALVGVAYQLRRTQPAWVAWLMAWLLGTAWGIFLVRLHRPIFNAYYITTAAPAFWLLAAHLMANRSLFSLKKGVFLLLLCANGWSLWHYYSDIPRFGRWVGYREIRQFLEAEATPQDIFVPNAPDPSFTYYLRGLNLPSQMHPSRPGLTPAEIEQALQSYDGVYNRVWFVPAKPELSFDPDQVAVKWLDYHWLHEFDVPAGELQLKAYRPVSALPAVLTSHQISVRDELALVGSYLMLNGRPLATPELHPQDKLEVTLVWQALQTPLPQDYKVFVHLLAADGSLITQQDSLPLYGTRPQTTWQAGEQLIDHYVLQLPEGLPAGSAQLVVGLYHPTTLERQLLSHQEPSFLLAQFQLK